MTTQHPAGLREALDPTLALSFADTLATMLEVLPQDCDVDGQRCIRHNAEWTENAGCEWVDGLQAIDLYRSEARALRAALAATGPALDGRAIADAVRRVSNREAFRFVNIDWTALGAALVEEFHR